MTTVRYIVSDVARAKTFFIDNLGFESRQDMLPAFASVRLGRLHLWLAGPSSSAARPMSDGRVPQPGGWNRIVIEVDDIESQVAKLMAAGVVLRCEVVNGRGGKQLVIDDPDGNPVELFEARQ
jgi:catechol 2,3-dioxygenase-like lactoylglutathione lyase family enzyme